MILYLVEKVKKTSQTSFYERDFPCGTWKYCSNINSKSLSAYFYWSWAYSIYTILLFLAKEYKEEFGEYDVQLVYYWISSLGSGIFLIILPFIL